MPAIAEERLAVHPNGGIVVSCAECAAEELGEVFVDSLQSVAKNVDLSALIIATFGALFSIASALYLTSRKISAEIKYRRLDLTNLYSGGILAMRLSKYPGVWYHICAFDKIIQRFPDANGI